MLLTKKIVLVFYSHMCSLSLSLSHTHTHTHTHNRIIYYLKERAHN